MALPCIEWENIQMLATEGTEYTEVFKSTDERRYTQILNMLFVR
jgi:hypothetical protein